MILQLFRARRRHVLVDINTQKDFLLADGKACIRNHRRIVAHIRRVMAWARHRNIPVISIADVHSNNDDGDLDSSGVGCCIDGTEGQKKVRYTLLANRVSFAADGNTDFPRDMMRRYRQVILHKRCLDPFDEPRIDRLLSEVQASEFILIGVSVEGDVEETVLGLLQRGKRVAVVVDAVGSHNKRDSQLALRKMEAKGARLIETKRLAGTSHLRLVGICDCGRCRGLMRKEAIGTAEGGVNA